MQGRGESRVCEPWRMRGGFIGEERAAPLGVRRPLGGGPPPHHGGILRYSDVNKYLFSRETWRVNIKYSDVY
jgi:hypothetical protein